MPLMTRLASGAAWNEADDSQRQALVESFTRMSASTYASEFDGYSGESFVIDGTRDAPREGKLVATHIVKSDGEKVPITYRMVAGSDGTWRIGDVLLGNSISELAVRRSEYAAVLRKDGVDGLVKTLNAKADGLMAAK
jgi:phospholipid transport system substrate-binding protein